MFNIDTFWMRLCNARSIETTPSPHCIKLNLNEVISTKALTLQQGATKPDAPAFAQQLLAIESVQSVFLFQDFITLTRTRICRLATYPC